MIFGFWLEFFFVGFREGIFFFVLECVCFFCFEVVRWFSFIYRYVFFGLSNDYKIFELVVNIEKLRDFL